jgi:hypothetical protein
MYRVNCGFKNGQSGDTDNIGYYIQKEIKNGQSRDTDNIGYYIQKENKQNKNKNTTNKLISCPITNTHS